MSIFRTVDLFSLWVSIFIDYLLGKGSLGCNVVVFNYAMFNEQRLIYSWGC